MRRCIVEGCSTLIRSGSRCHAHNRTRRNERYGGQWRHRSAAAITLHVATYGYQCPGWATDPHPATDLTLDHETDQVICRACNARKKALGAG